MSNIIKSGSLRGDKVAYDDGVGCCIWYPFESEDGNEEAGICFDFHAKDIDDLIKLLQMLKEAEPEIYLDQEEQDIKESEKSRTVRL